jgi:hypothetical protein
LEGNQNLPVFDDQPEAGNLRPKGSSIAEETLNLPILSAFYKQAYKELNREVEVQVMESQYPMGSAVQNHKD